MGGEFGDVRHIHVIKPIVFLMVGTIGLLLLWNLNHVQVKYHGSIFIKYNTSIYLDVYTWHGDIT